MKLNGSPSRHKKNSILNGIVPGQSIIIVSVESIGDDALTVFCKDNSGAIGAVPVLEKLTMDAVMEKEKSLGYAPQDVSLEKYGWDILSRTGKGEVRFIEVKGRVKGAPTITVTKNEILASLNQPERFILAIVLIEGESTEGPYYLHKPFDQEPEFQGQHTQLSSLTMILPGS